VAGKPFSYRIGVTLADSRTTITRYDNNPNKIIQAAATNSGSQTTNLFASPYVGQDVGEIWGFIIDGYFKTDEEAQAYPVDMRIVNSGRLASSGEWSQLRAGDLKYVDFGGVKDVIDRGDGTLDNPGDMRVIGNRLPRYSYGITLGADWNGLDVSVFMHGIGKQNWYPGSDANLFWGPYGRPYYTYIPKDIAKDIWTPENPDAYFPVLRAYESNTGGMSFPNNKYLQDLAYIRLQNLTIGYRLPQKWAGKVHIQNCRIYLSGENLWYHTKLRSEYIDPEVIAGGTDTNGRRYPFSKTYSFGLDITF
jgi:hypothetical protein